MTLMILNDKYCQNMTTHAARYSGKGLWGGSKEIKNTHEWVKAVEKYVIVSKMKRNKIFYCVVVSNYASKSGYSDVVIRINTN